MQIALILLESSPLRTLQSSPLLVFVLGDLLSSLSLDTVHLKNLALRLKTQTIKGGVPLLAC